MRCRAFFLYPRGFSLALGTSDGRDLIGIGGLPEGRRVVIRLGQESLNGSLEFDE